MAVPVDVIKKNIIKKIDEGLAKLKAAEDCKSMKLIFADMAQQIRGITGEHSESAEGVFDISNKQRLGLTEIDAVKQKNDGVKKPIELKAAEP